MNRKHNQPISEIDFPDHDRRVRRPMSAARKRRLGTTVTVAATASVGLGLLASGAMSGPDRIAKHAAVAAGQSAKEAVTGSGAPGVEAFAANVEQGQGTVELGTNSLIPSGTLLYTSPADESQAGGGANNSVPVPTGENLSVSGLVVSTNPNQGVKGAPWQAVTVDFTGKPELMFTPYNVANTVAETTETQNLENELNPHVNFEGPFIYVSGKGVTTTGHGVTPTAMGTLVPENQ